MLRSFNTSWASLSDQEIENLEEWDPDTDDNEKQLARTPLCSAINVNAVTIVRLFLKYHADPNGYQSREFDDEGEPYRKITPLFNAISIGKPYLVDMLLQARADPNQWGFELDLYGEAVHPDGDCETPLWQAVYRACDCSPGSLRGLASRAIVRLLLSHSARPDRKGKIEYFSGCGSQSVIRTLGDKNTSDSETTPLEAACKRKAAGLDPELVGLTADPSWSADVVDILRATWFKRNYYNFV